MKKWKVTEEVIKEFKEQARKDDKIVTTLEEKIKTINPERIIAINDVYEYPEILNDYKMKKIREKVEIDKWKDEVPQTFCLLELPNGDLLVNGNGNHRAVLTNELGIKSAKAFVAEVKYVK
ncbi:hypothetical protein P9858_13120 [Niallia circulans]|uniref:hypothetical protein n=1 Tax=Niallia circulans TaxID=1397 RepID=UPI002E208487|nr:hypothetical protein [Niallia circulans]